MPPSDLSKRKLGKALKKTDPRTLQLRRYLKLDELPIPPAAVDYSEKMGPLGPMLNDTLGDCTCAAVGHVIQEETSETDSAPVIVSDSAILTMYEAVSGYDPATGANDNGAVVIDVLNYWHKTGVAGDQLGAYAEIQPADQTLVRAVAYTFGNVYLGLQMPLSAQGQAVWDVPPGGPTGNGSPGSWGGHAVPIVAYDADGVTVISWGERIQATWAFLATYCDEAYALLSKDWLAPGGESPPGFDLAQLQADLVSITAAPPPSPPNGVTACLDQIGTGVDEFFTGKTEQGIADIEGGILCLVKGLALNPVRIALKAVENSGEKLKALVDEEVRKL